MNTIQYLSQMTAFHNTIHRLNSLQPAINPLFTNNMNLSDRAIGLAYVDTGIQTPPSPLMKLLQNAVFFSFDLHNQPSPMVGLWKNEPFIRNLVASIPSMRTCESSFLQENTFAIKFLEEIRHIQWTDEDFKDVSLSEKDDTFVRQCISTIAEDACTTEASSPEDHGLLYQYLYYKDKLTVSNLILIVQIVYNLIEIAPVQHISELKESIRFLSFLLLLIRLCQNIQAE